MTLSLAAPIGVSAQIHSTELGGPDTMAVPGDRALG